METYDNPASRNQQKAAEIPNKVSVPFPEKVGPQGGSGGVAKTPSGFDSGLITGKV